MIECIMKASGCLHHIPGGKTVKCNVTLYRMNSQTFFPGGGVEKAVQPPEPRSSTGKTMHVPTQLYSSR